MDEQVITQKQFKTIKTVRGMLLAIFILVIVFFAIMGLEFAAFAFIPQVLAAMQQELGALLLSSAFMVVILITVAILLYSKNKNRKKTVAIMMFVYALIFTLYGASYFAVGQQLASGLYIAGMIIFTIANVSFIILTVMLLNKTKGKPLASQYIKRLFILYVIFIYLSDAMIVIAIPANLSFYIVIKIIILIVIGLGNILFLAPQFAVYKGISDDVFYQYFIVNNPRLVIQRYEAAMWKPAAQPVEEERFCANCGAALTPGASFCRQCGKPVNTRK